MESSVSTLGNILAGPMALSLGLLIFMLIFSAFLKISVIFGFLRIGLGLNSFGGSILAGSVAFVLAFFVMKPGLERTFQELSAPCKKEISSPGCLPEITEKWKEFVIKQTPTEMRDKFQAIANKQTNGNANNPENSAQNNLLNTDWQILAPAFVISELEKSFSIGIKILLPFLVIDLVIAYIFTALGIQVMAAAALAFPLKILAFSILNGWTLIAENVLKSYVGS